MSATSTSTAATTSSAVPGMTNEKVARIMLAGSLLATFGMALYLGYKNGMFAILGLSGASSDEEDNDADQPPLVHLTRDQTVAILRKLAIRFHGGCREFTEMTRSVSESLHEKGLTLTQEQLRDQLQEQGEILGKLKELETNILMQEGITARDLQAAQAKYSDDSEVKLISEGFDIMLEASLEGHLPIIPWMKEPDIDKSALLELMRHMQEFEVVKVCKYFREAGGILKSVQDLGKVLAKASLAAESEIIEMYDRPVELYYSCIGYYMQTSSAFKKEKEEMEADHKARMMRMFRPVEGNEISKIELQYNDVKSEAVLRAKPVNGAKSKAKGPAPTSTTSAAPSSKASVK